jgi:hypothetical protein
VRYLVYALVQSGTPEYRERSRRAAIERAKNAAVLHWCVYAVVDTLTGKGWTVSQMGSVRERP